MGNNRIPFEPESYYHLYNHGNADDNVFRCEDNFHFFLQKYAYHLEAVVDTYAYCLLPNHFHFLIKIKGVKKLEELFKQRDLNNRGLNLSQDKISNFISQKFSNFLNAYVKAFNKKYERKGSLFLSNIKRKKIENETYFLRLVQYIHNNPKSHGFVNDIADWPFSSYHAMVTLSNSKVRRNEVLEWFGGLENFKEMHR